MNKKIFVSVTALATLIISFVVYTNFVKKYEIIINEEVILKDTSKKLDKIVDDEIEKYKDELVKKSRTLVSDVEKQYNEELDLIKSEEIEIKKISKYEFKIDVIHKVKRIMSEEIPFEKQTVEDPNTYSTYSAIQTPGQNGNETVTFTSTYVNGKFINFKDKDVVKLDPVNEVTVVGTMALPGGSSNYTNGSNYKSGSYAGVSGGNASSGSTSGGNKVPTGMFPNYDACWAYGQAQLAANGGNGRFMCWDAPAYDGSQDYAWWDR